MSKKFAMKSIDGNGIIDHLFEGDIRRLNEQGLRSLSVVYINLGDFRKAMEEVQIP